MLMQVNACHVQISDVLTPCHSRGWDLHQKCCDLLSCTRWPRRTRSSGTISRCKPLVLCCLRCAELESTTARMGDQNHGISMLEYCCIPHCYCYVCTSSLYVCCHQCFLLHGPFPCRTGAGACWSSLVSPGAGCLQCPGCLALQRVASSCARPAAPHGFFPVTGSPYFPSCILT